MMRASFFLHHEEKLAYLRDCFAKAITARFPSLAYTFVGTRQGKRLEIELTARLAYPTLLVPPAPQTHLRGL